MASAGQIALITKLALARGLDPQAILSVARQEGLSGGIGDAGTSFGPFQLHVGGAFPSGIQGNRQAWAWSPAGISYALNRIQSVASGLRGGAAVNAIVRRFERPANPNAEVAGALASLGQTPYVGIPGFNPPIGATAVPAPNKRNLLLQAILRGQSDLTNVIAQEYAGNPLGGSVSPPNGLIPSGLSDLAPGMAPGVLGSVSPAELLQEGIGGPTHSTGPHIHVAYTNPKAVLAAIRLAESLGLHVGENPYVGSVAPVHAKNSYHYRDFPGTYNGRKLGEAIDVSGKRASQFYRILSNSRKVRA